MRKLPKVSSKEVHKVSMQKERCSCNFEVRAVDMLCSEIGISWSGNACKRDGQGKQSRGMVDLIILLTFVSKISRMLLWVKMLIDVCITGCIVGVINSG